LDFNQKHAVRGTSTAREIQMLVMRRGGQNDWRKPETTENSGS